MVICSSLVSVGEPLQIYRLSYPRVSILNRPSVLNRMKINKAYQSYICTNRVTGSDDRGPFYTKSGRL